MANEDKLFGYLKKVTADLHQARQRLRAAEDRDREPVAIVAAACRLPGGVDSLEDLWRLVRTGTDAVSGLPTDRGWDLDRLRRPGATGSSAAHTGGFLASAGDFDPAAFGISPREALVMDPQQRLLLELTWEALERAGIDPTSLRGSGTGVFAGVTGQEYGPTARELSRDPDGFGLTGRMVSVASGRVAYSFGFEGPALTVDTACSSSLVALHLACRSLRAGECDLALAGGVTVMATPAAFVEFSRQGGLAADGRCKSFAEGADGTGWGEGAGLLLLQRLSDARRAGHEVLAVIRGSAVNSDGASNGLTAPNGPAQRRVIRDALVNAGLDESDVDLVEAHGTGTVLGDPIEAQALIDTFGRGRDPDRPLWLGSVKSNIGHTQAAAGVAGVIKVVQAIRHGELPRTLHVDAPTSRVAWPDAVRLLTGNRPWPGDRPRRAGVSSFGISGTNAHVIIEQAPEAQAPAVEVVAPPPVVAWPISGNTPDAVRAQAERLLAHVADRQDLPAVDVAYSLGTARAALRERAVVLGADRAALLTGLRAVADGRDAPEVFRGAVDTGGRVGFVFSGQGGQWSGMGHGLHAAFPAFAAAFDDACAEVDRHLGQAAGVRDVVFGSDRSLVDRTLWAQTGVFALQIGLLGLLDSWGVRPDAVMGHSVGEVVAAHAAGVLTLPEAARLVAGRARLMQALPEGGAMLAVSTSVAEIGPVLVGARDRVVVAAVNGPESVVLSGDRDLLTDIADRLRTEGCRTRWLPVSHAFHSPHMDPVLEEFTRIARGGEYRAPHLPIVSTVTGELDRAGRMGEPDHWVRQVRAPVRYADGVRALAEHGVDLVVELGPDGALAAIARDSAPGVTGIALVRKDRDAATAVMSGLARIHARGHAVDWRAVLGGTGARRVELPTYAFQRQRYWWVPADGRGDVAGAGLAEADHPLFGALVALADGDGVVLTGRLSVASHPWLAEHRVHGEVVVPGTAVLEVVAHLGERVGCGLVDDLSLEAPWVLPGHGAIQVRLSAGPPGESGARSMALHTRPDDATDSGWTRHATGSVRPAESVADEEPFPWPPANATAIDVDGVYAHLDALGVHYGPGFRCLRSAWRRGGEIFAEVASPDGTAAGLDRFGVHPALLDAVLHAAAGDSPVLRVPFSWRGARLRATRSPVLRARVSVTGDDRLSLVVTDPAGGFVASVDALVTRPLSSPNPSADSLYEVRWHPLDAPAVTGEISLAAIGGGVEVPEHPIAGFATLDHLRSDVESGGAVPEWVLVTAMADGAEDRDLPSRAAVAMSALLVLLRDWLADERFAGSRLVVVTRGAVAEVSDLAHAPAWGLVRSAQSEHPERFALVDVDGTPASWRAVPAALRTGEPQLALRGGVALVPRLARLDARGPRPRFGVDGTVLVTGGTGALGGSVARHLVREHGVRHVVLVSRRGPGAPGARELADELAAGGAAVEVVACDVGDRVDLARVVAAIPADRPLGGIVHAAGALADGVLESLSERDIATAFAPKVAGAWHLHELTRELDLSYFVLFSSFAGIVGSAGQAGYAAANTFLDALAHRRRVLGLPGVSLAWGPWAHPGGMTGAMTAPAADRLARAGVTGLTVEDGLRLFDTATALDAACVVPVGLDRSPLLERGRANPLPPLLTRLVPVRAATASRGVGADEDALLAAVREHVVVVMGYRDAAEVGSDRAFRDLGFDSLSGVELRNRLAEALGIRLPATAVFDHPTPRVLARFLRGELVGRAGERVHTPEVGTGADDPIVIVGMGCRYPGGVSSPEDLWRLVVDGVDAVSAFPDDRGWDLGRLFDPDPGRVGTSYTREGGFLRDAAEFDAGFFGVSPREALAMDPQQRLLLEVAWETVERAGIDASSLRGSRTGVFAGSMYHDYGARFLDNSPAGFEGHLGTGSAGSVLSGRIAYAFGFEGPAVTVDTACSSSLVALHLACQSLRTGECDLAFAGGVTVMATPTTFVEFSRQRGLAADGRCKSFAEGADGTGWGEGAGLVLLERLSDALHNGHDVVAVVRGSAVNSDGASNGLTAPNGPAQQRVIRRALANAGLEPSDVDVVEGHGTGTVLGDPIEAQALIATYGQGRDRPLWLGSVKSNIGHAQAAAGVAGIIKMAQAMRHGELPRTLHVDAPSARVDWSAGAVRLLTENAAWPGDRPRRAGVSSFGISGTNAHVILEQPPRLAEPAAAPRGHDGAPVLWPLSAKTGEALRAQAERLVAHLADRPGEPPVDTGLALATSRSALGERAVVVGADRESLLTGLRALADGREVPEVIRGSADADGRIGFVFSGQGGQWPGMGHGLHARYPAFATAFDGACAALDAHLEREIRVRDVVFGADRPSLDRTLWAQTGLFATQVGLLGLLASWGVRPDAVLGHSVGEVAAAFAAGVLSLDDAARLVACRARLMEALPEGGAMLSVAAGADVVRPLLHDIGPVVDIAALNAAGSVVLSGDRDALIRVAARLDGLRVRHRWLRVSHAFHSHRVDPVLEAFAQVAGAVRYRRPEVPIVAALTGDLDTTGDMSTPGYWVRQVREPVRFADGVEALVRRGVRTVLEIGPDALLSVPVRDSGRVTALPVMRRGRDEAVTVATAVAGVHVHGGAVDWGAFFAPSGAVRVELPTYAFQRRRYWLDPDGSRVDDWRYRVSWEEVALSPGRAVTGRWLVVVPDGWAVTARARSFQDVLEARGAVAVVVELTRNDQETLVGALRAAGDPTGVLSLHALDDSTSSNGVVDSLLLLRSLHTAGITAPLWWATSGGVAVGEVPVNPRQAMVWGLGRVVGLEHPDRWGGLIDLPDAVDDDARERLCAVLAGVGEDEVAIRPSRVFARRLVRATTPASGAVWRPRGSVLVTGGTGGLGAHVARWLARAGAEHVVLVSRRGADAAGAEELRAELAAMGARTSVVACDVADREALAQVLESVPTLRAVVHAAGVLETGDVLSVDPAGVDNVLSAKVAGAENLDALLAGVDLDAFVLFSSVSGVWGARGHGVYAAANAHLDALAERRRAAGSVATSVAWGPWAGDGMAAGRSASDRLRRSGLVSMPPERAVAALRDAPAHDGTPLVIADVEWSRFAALFTSGRPRPLLDRLPEARRAIPAIPVPVAGRSPAQARRAMTDLVLAEVARVAAHDDPGAIGPDRPFQEFGFDSLMAVELRDRLGAATGLALPATVVFDYPNPAALAERLAAEASGTERATTVTTAVAPDDDPVAVVAMGCRYPGGVSSPEDLWRLVSEGRDAVSAFPTDRGWDTDALFDPDRPGGTYVREGAFLTGADRFDADFFGISPREARAMDPQQRLLLEVAWEVFERAGIPPRSARGGRTGVFVGTNGQDHGARAVAAPEAAGHLLTGAAASVMAGRLSYTFGLVGPAIAVDTACSSSLVALHLACRSLRSGECDSALAGGVTVMSTPLAFVEFSHQRGLAPDGRCKSFAEAADGTAWGEGAGLVLLERLSDARRNGHRVLAVIRGSAVNQDGASNGLTAPNGPAQERVIREALANAGLGTSDVDVVEAHGTGTRLGDPIEARALLATYGQDRDRPLWLGSVKSNIGHTQAAAGVAGVIKVVMAMRHGELPATLHVDRPATRVDWSAGAVRLLTARTPWPDRDHPRRAGVSSFGVSGTNAHLVLEHPAPERRAPAAASPLAVPERIPWVLSAGSASALRDQAARLRDRLDRDRAVSPVDVGHSLATTRSALAERAVVTGTDRESLLSGLSALAEGRTAPGVVTGSARPGGRVAFAFSGQGGQWLGMGRDLAAAFPGFADAFGEVCDALRPHLGADVRDVLFGADERELHRERWAQPGILAVQLGLVGLLRSWGVRPDVVLGQSMGEVAAACAAGILTVSDAARLMAARGRLVESLPPGGAMLAVALGESEVAPLLADVGDGVGVAVVNGPGSVVLSGDRDALTRLVAALDASGTRTAWLRVSYASHSHRVAPILPEYAEVVAGVAFGVPVVPIVSAVSGAPDTTGLLRTAEYWVRQLREPVRFADGVRALVAGGVDTVVDIGPDGTLSALVQECLAESGAEHAAAVAITRRDRDAAATALAGLGRLHARGVEVDWSAHFAGTGARTVDLPTYAFQRQRFWLAERPAPRRADPVDSRFWELVASADPEPLARELSVDRDRPFHEVLPALAAWHERHHRDTTARAWRYQVRWRPVQVPSTARLRGVWLVVTAAGHTGHRQAVLDALTEHGAEAAVLGLPQGCCRDVLAERLRAAVTSHGEVAGVLFLSPAGGEPGAHPATAALVLAQALGDAGVPAPLWLGTTGGVAVGTGDVPVDPNQGAVWGLGRVVGLEHPGRWGGLVDLPAELDARSRAGLVAALAGIGAEDQLAVRSSGLFARRLTRADHTRAPGTWRARGTVLVTGGTGALGARVARWLAERGAEHLVLLSRSGPRAPGAAELTAELTALGARVTTTACDVTDVDALAAVLAAVPDEFPLSAVVHTAGVGTPGDLAETTPEEFADVLSAKVAGAANLDRLLGARPLDAFVLFSSIAGVWGAGGQGAYSAANAYLDALAEHRAALGRPATSVAWGAWAGAGMAVRGGTEARLRRRGLVPMDPPSALAALEQALSAGDTAVTVADVEWERFAASFAVARPRPLLDEVVPPADAEHTDDRGGDDIARRLSDLPPAERAHLLVELVIAETATTLGHDSPNTVAPEKTFAQLGFDSLTAVELRNRLNAATGLRLPPTLVFDHPTPTALAEHLLPALVPEPADEIGSLLDRLATALAQASPTDSGRPDTAARLRALLLRCDPAPESLSSATDDELFDLIDRKLRR
ncbi:type I polyketide synthase [Actinokineospora globicatena]|uniref:Acyl transferase domain-containing protein n=1 Tax=Actinokineospora globicatena TaxID=103729 RepID=A0A9W6QFB0_9PSEU|nr:type I polyketide synthase [Actinokineospora globicatena]GLW89896.1 hypothetical protein Aglo03_07120 [Actinokineospora globicatena]